MTREADQSTLRRRRAARALVVAAIAGAAAGAAACNDLGTNPSEVVSMSFDSLPSPSVVVGDTMRDDSTGLVAPIAADAFNASGQRIQGAKFTYFVHDTSHSAEIVSGDLLVALKPRDAADTIFATSGNLQLTRTFEIVPRPDSLIPSATFDTSVFLIYPDTAAIATKNLSVALPAYVTHAPQGTGDVADSVRSWVVYYRLVWAAPTVADSVRLVDDAGRPSTRDTTNAAGLAGRRVRVYTKVKGTSGEATKDSVVVAVRARYRGQDLPARKLGTEPQDGELRIMIPVVGLKP